MLKRFAFTVAALFLSVVVAMAAPVAGKVTAVDGDKITIELQADKPAWMKAGAPVKIKSVGPGKVAELSGKTVTLTSKKASSVKAGDAVSIDKGGMSGC